MTDFETIARAEDRSWAADTDWLKELAEEHGAPVFENGAWRFPVSREGEQQK